MAVALASRLGFALRHAQKSGVDSNVLDHVVAALKVLGKTKSKASDNADSMSHPDPWWCGKDPWRQDEKLTINCNASGVLNPHAHVFSPGDWLHLPSFVPAVANADGAQTGADLVSKLDKQVETLSISVAEVTKRMDLMSDLMPTDVLSCANDTSMVKRFEAELLNMQTSIEKEFAEYDEVLTEIRNSVSRLEQNAQESFFKEVKVHEARISELSEILALQSEKIDGAEGLFREISLTEARVKQYQNRWWQAEKINQDEIDAGLQSMKDLGAPDWAILDARMKHKQTAKTFSKMGSLAKEIDKLWRHVYPAGYGENEADAV